MVFFVSLFVAQMHRIRKLVKNEQNRKHFKQKIGSETR